MAKMKVKAMAGTKVSIGVRETSVGGVVTVSLAFQTESNRNDEEEIENLRERTQLNDVGETDWGD